MSLKIRNQLVQTQNPKTRHWVVINPKKGVIVKTSRTINPYKGIEKV